MAQTSSSSRKPIFFTFAGLVTIGAMIAMPLLAGQPDGDKVPDIVRFVGRFHPLVLHLPIGMVTLAILLELTRLFSKGEDKKRGGAGSLVLGFCAASAVVAVILGFLLYQGGGWDESKLAEQHMWRGIFFAVAMIVTFLAKMWSDAAGGSGAWFSKAGLLVSTAVMGIASHDGGSLTHGENYLTEEAPAPIRKALGLPPKDGKSKHEGGSDGVAASPEQLVVYTDLVAPILEKRCTNCHNADKSKGKLRLDTYELIVKGGKNGSSIEPGNFEKSHLTARILLPKDDEEHMPPEEKPQVEEHELAVLKWWIASGADPKKTVAELNPPADVKAALAKLGTGGSSKSAATAKTEGGAPAPGAAPKATPADPALKTQVAGFAKEFPGALTFESQQSPYLTFTAVSLREHLDDNAFQKLQPVVKHLVTADLSATKVTDKSVALLSSAANLRMVRLSETGVTDASIDALVKLSKLESVNLYGTAVTDGGVQKLAGLPNLKRLYLWQTKVTPQAIDELKKKLPNCEIVTGA
ncbi:hypothetical protein KBB96_02270 [Luteolibacter ambystomatis]|uniref:Uncharacterized protein n=1 Tax=Luteolibacter ambystomatis TaxID=2824561 RepID=A0A975J0F2_9BACT|nr:c-type cytochrome domain-containing protein [Luteolibacter ambystomatis]QUE51725.1 hypothetical protein KBB96_02270 [Luteolibacter ambystomatis]